MSNAFEPTNPTDNCAYCGRVRASDWHRVTSNPGTHAFVEPAPQSAPSGDEAKVREILDRTGWFFEVPRDRAQLVGHDEVLGLLREAYAAGKADGAREEREACGKLGRDVQAHYERQILVEQQSGAYQGEVVATAKREIGKRIADAIARRGSEGK